MHKKLLIFFLIWIFSYTSSCLSITNFVSICYCWGQCMCFSLLDSRILLKSWLCYGGVHFLLSKWSRSSVYSWSFMDSRFVIAYLVNPKFSMILCNSFDVFTFRVLSTTNTLLIIHGKYQKHDKYWQLMDKYENLNEQGKGMCILLKNSKHKVKKPHWSFWYVIRGFAVKPILAFTMERVSDGNRI